jgi:hypothetical protein
MLKTVSYIYNIIITNSIVIISSTIISRALEGYLRTDFAVAFNSGLLICLNYIIRSLLLDSQSTLFYPGYLISLDFYRAIRELMIFLL